MGWIYPGTSRYEIFRRISAVLYASSDPLPNSICRFFCILLAVSSWYWQNLWFALYFETVVSSAHCYSVVDVWLGRSLWEHSLARRRCVNSWFAIASVNLQPTCACLCIIASMICKGNRLDSQHSSGCEGRRSRFCLYSTSLPPCDAMNWTTASYGLLRSSDSWQVGSYMDFSHDCVPLFVVFSLESLSRERESDQISMGKKDRVW